MPNRLGTRLRKNIAVHPALRPGCGAAPGIESAAPVPLSTTADFRETTVGPTVFQALDRAIEAGGSNLAAKDIVGTGKGPSAVLDEMCSSGLLEKAAGRAGGKHWHSNIRGVSRHRFAVRARWPDRPCPGKGQRLPR